MKGFIFFVIIAIGAAYFFYVRNSNGVPEEITDPYFGELTIKQQIGSRNLTIKAYGKLQSKTDCDMRGKRAMSEVFKECPECDVVDFQCQSELPVQAQNLFENQPTHLAYIAMQRGNTLERDERAIVWGLTKAESSKFCSYMIPLLKKKYSGTVSCIDALEKS